jgi:hypothetical protein
MDITEDFLASIKLKQSSIVSEIVLLEFNESSKIRRYDVAIIECPCVKQTTCCCNYCRCILEVTKHEEFYSSMAIRKSISQQTIDSISHDIIHDEINLDDQFYTRLDPHSYQHSIEIQAQSAIIDHESTEHNRSTVFIEASQHLVNDSGIDVQVR